MMDSFIAPFSKYTEKVSVIASMPFAKALRRSFMNLLPIVLIGAFAVAINWFPIQAYVDWTQTNSYGIFQSSFLNVISTATLGFLSIYLVTILSYHYSAIYRDKGTGDNIMSTISSLLLFLAMTIINAGQFDTSAFGTAGTFFALISSFLGVRLYSALSKTFDNLFSSAGSNSINLSIKSIIPTALIAMISALPAVLIANYSDFPGVNAYVQNIAASIFTNLGNGLLSGSVYIFLCSLLWCFGIHGSNVLQVVENTFYVPNLDANIAAVEAGGTASNILTMPFINSYVLLGGCGATLALLIGLLIYAKRKDTRRIAYLSIAPSLLNINEPLVFGLPIIFNPALVIPFLICPLMNFLLAYAFTSMGLIPVIYTKAIWSTPVGLIAYISTNGSLFGTIFPFLLLVLDALVYLPFVKVNEDMKTKEDISLYKASLAELKKSELDGYRINLTKVDGEVGNFSSDFVLEIEDAIRTHQFKMFFQPQTKADGTTEGVEALLRYNHPYYGMVYPPLVVKLSQEGGFESAFEEETWQLALKSFAEILPNLPDSFTLSVNSTVSFFISKHSVDKIAKLADEYNIPHNRVVIEITEEMKFNINDETKDILKRAKELGFRLSVDDFTAGSTSLKILQTGYFDEAKLDGVLVHDVTNPTTQNIIVSMVTLANSMHLHLVAEFVETQEQRNILESLGVKVYQGWLYSKALPIEELKTYLFDNKGSAQTTTVYH